MVSQVNTRYVRFLKKKLGSHHRIDIQNSICHSDCPLQSYPILSGYPSKLMDSPDGFRNTGGSSLSALDLLMDPESPLEDSHPKSQNPKKRKKKKKKSQNPEAVKIMNKKIERESLSSVISAAASGVRPDSFRNTGGSSSSVDPKIPLEDSHPKSQNPGAYSNVYYFVPNLNGPPAAELESVSSQYLLLDLMTRKRNRNDVDDLSGSELTHHDNFSNKDFSIPEIDAITSLKLSGPDDYSIQTGRMFKVRKRKQSLGSITIKSDKIPDGWLRLNQMPSMNESRVNPTPIEYGRTQSEFPSNSGEFCASSLPTLPLNLIDGIKNIDPNLKSSSSSDSSIDRTERILKMRERDKGMSSLRNKTKSDEIQEDGFTWIKYAKKMILNNQNPRFYFRCENKYTQGCVARKTVQKDEYDPSYCIISYHGEHKCCSSPSWVPSSEYLERCLSYCLLFPPEYEFESDSMVQLWIAEEVIDGEATDRLEDKGYICLERLQSHGFIEPSGLQERDDHLKFKVSQHLDSKHYASRRPLVDDFLIISKDGFSNLSEILQMRQTLRTLLLLGDSKHLVKQVPRNLFLSLNLLRTLVLSGTQVSELPSSVGNLEDLRYFDLSGTLVKELPGVLCDLVSLQTLKLRDCSEFIALPKGMMKLINLRHLDLDIVQQLSYMPKSIGKLINLQTFKGFIVGTDEDCGIGELCQLNNITGSFSISCLENVSDVEEAKRADLRSKSYITKLVLRWDECINSETEQEILECLSPHPNLSELQIQFFSGSALPSWISDPSFTNLISITFYKCINCSFLPSIGNLPSLQFLNILGMDKVMDINGLFCNDNRGSSHRLFFPELEELIIDNMTQLEKWTIIRAGDFPCLHHLSIRNCPKLVELPSMSSLDSLEYLELNDCPELECLPDMPDSLGTLIIQDCPKLQEHCRKGEGRDWLKFANVPNIWIQHRQVS